MATAPMIRKIGPTTDIAPRSETEVNISIVAATVWAIDWLPALCGEPDPVAQPSPQPDARVGIAKPAAVAARPTGNRHSACGKIFRQACRAVRSEGL